MKYVTTFGVGVAWLLGAGACDYASNSGTKQDATTENPTDTTVATETTVTTEPDTTVTDTTVDDTTDTVADTDDTTVTDTTTDTDTTNPNACAVAEELFLPYCVDCHDGELNFPNLTPGSLKYLSNANAAAYPGAMLVVPGDPDASLLYRKVHGPGSTEGLIMPPVDEAPASAIETLAQWIRDGAAECPGATDLGASTPAIPTPGGTITIGALASGFQATRPNWAEQGICTSNQWWKYSGDTESSSMHPGSTCIDCHTSNHGPSYSYAGTVYPNISDSEDCRGASGVKVQILDAEDNILATTTTNTAGNFYLKKTTYPFKPYRVVLTLAGRTREMQLVQSTSGDCNTCHSTNGKNGALGRIVAP